MAGNFDDERSYRDRIGSIAGKRAKTFGFPMEIRGIVARSRFNDNLHYPFSDRTIGAFMQVECQAMLDYKEQVLQKLVDQQTAMAQQIITNKVKDLNISGEAGFEAWSTQISRAIETPNTIIKLIKQQEYLKLARYYYDKYVSYKHMAQGFSDSFEREYHVGLTVPSVFIDGEDRLVRLRLIITELEDFSQECYKYVAFFVQLENKKRGQQSSTPPLESS